MKLIRVEAKGFKSFADKTVLNFDGGVVGVVGPNGSGKSNINDAIKWVLGESSAKTLRGDKMDDVIFAGSSKVKEMSKAEVSLTFDNSEKKVAIYGSKFTITRVLERGQGGNKYYINGELARLKDIKEIAMESGIGKSSLAIISQGTVSDIAEATPEQRRGIFEEAAGISKYKSRKIEALKKLDNTSEALDKIKAVVRELERQLNPLRKQAEKAKVYLKKRKELKSIEIAAIVKDVTFFEEKLTLLNSELESVISSKEDLAERIGSCEKLLEEKTQVKFKIENEVLDLTKQLDEISNKLRDVQIRESKVSERRKMIISGEVESSNQAKLDAMKAELEALGNKINSYIDWEEKTKLDINQRQSRVATLRTESSNLQIGTDQYKSNLIKIRARVQILKEHKKNKTNLFQGTKTIIKNQDQFKGVHGIVSDVIDVKKEYITAIDSILSSALQNIVVEDSSIAVKCVNFLKANRAGRATFIPLKSIQPKGLREKHLLALESQEGFIGTGASLVQTDPKFAILAKFLLGNIIVAKDIDSANYLSQLLEKRYMIVTLDGDIVRPGGTISGGAKSRKVSIIGADEQIKEMEESIPLLEDQIIKKTSKINALNNEVIEEQKIISELNIELAKAQEKKLSFESKFNSLKTEYESKSNTSFELENASWNESTENLESQKSSINSLLKAKRSSIISLNTDLSHLTITKTELEKTRREILDASATKMNDKNKAEFIINSARERLISEYELTIESAYEDYKLDMPIEKAREIVDQLKSDIKELGHINLDSIDAYEEVNLRYTKLHDSQSELAYAKNTILSAIAEMDKIIINRLDETIINVNQVMEPIFKNMFGGGTAQVKYTNPNNLLETGIDVIAQPPGKTVKNLKLFSGGEKALIAISLLFAILKSKPLPLCILDEVEAALDDANVVRFADYLQELKLNTQFIVVTHRVGTMSRVDHLFGATMQNRGVTTILSVDLQKAKKIID